LTRAVDRFDLDWNGPPVAPERFSRIIARTSDIAIALDHAGIVTALTVNPDVPALGCLDHWIGRDLRDFVTVECREKIDARLAAIAAGETDGGRALELNHVDNANWEFPIRYTLHDCGDGMHVLLLGRDLRTVAKVQQQLVREQIAREHDHERYRGIETRFRVLLDRIDQPVVMIDPESGRIGEINPAGAELLGAKTDALAGTNFVQALEGRERREFLEALKASAQAEGKTSVPAKVRRNGREVSIRPELFRAGGEMVLLCRMSVPQEPKIAESRLARLLRRYYDSASEAIVFTDPRGLITEANEAFLVLCDVTQLKDLIGRPLADFLVRGTMDTGLLLDTAARSGRLRSYPTHLRSLVGTAIAVEISALRLRDRDEPGMAFVIRETTFEPGESGAPAMTNESMREIMELVGTAPLRDLVAATTDVVEKICIETALKLTGNNRVAAAEMLGLSRQSLYVKLRKFGFISSGGDD